MHHFQTSFEWDQFSATSEVHSKFNFKNYLIVFIFNIKVGIWNVFILVFIFIFQVSGLNHFPDLITQKFQKSMIIHWEKSTIGILIPTSSNMVTTPPQQFCVRWNSYQSNLQSAFPKLLSSEHFVDVTLACENEMLKCHKVVLSACSTYFEKLLLDNPCQHPIILMKDMRWVYVLT